MTPQTTSGWIDHKPGDPMPVSGDTLVDVRFRLGIGAQFETAEDLCWDEVGQMDIIAYRPSYGPAGNMAAEPTEPAAGERRALVAALERISAPMDCGCKPCMGQCRSESALQITVDEMQGIATEALTALNRRALTQPQPETEIADLKDEVLQWRDAATMAERDRSDWKAKFAEANAALIDASQPEGNAVKHRTTLKLLDELLSDAFRMRPDSAFNLLFKSDRAKAAYAELDAALTSPPPAAPEADRLSPDIWWRAEDAEMPIDPSDIAGDYDPGDIVELQCARALPNCFAIVMLPLNEDDYGEVETFPTAAEAQAAYAVALASKTGE